MILDILAWIVLILWMLSELIVFIINKYNLEDRLDVGYKEHLRWPSWFLIKCMIEFAADILFGWIIRWEMRRCGIHELFNKFDLTKKGRNHGKKTLLTYR